MSFALEGLSVRIQLGIILCSIQGCHFYSKTWKPGKVGEMQNDERNIREIVLSEKICLYFKELDYHYRDLFNML